MNRPTTVTSGETSTSVPMPQNAPKCPIKNGSAQVTLTPERLTPAQAKAIELLLLATPLRKVIEILQIDRKTLYRWRRHRAFARELSRRQALAWDSAADRVRALLEPAIDVLGEQLRDPYDDTRFRAASTLLRLANIKDAVAVEES